MLADGGADLQNAFVETLTGSNCNIDLLGSMVVGVYDLRASNIGPVGCQK